MEVARWLAHGDLRIEAAAEVVAIHFAVVVVIDAVRAGDVVAFAVGVARLLFGFIRIGRLLHNNIANRG